MKCWSNLFWLGFCVTFFLVMGSVQSYALSGKEIMEKVKEIKAWENEVAQVSFLMISNDKRTRLRHVLRRRRNYAGKDGLDTKTLMVFQYPPKYHNYAYLSWSYREFGKKDQKWVYNPNDTFHFKPVRRLLYDLRDNFLGFWLEGNDFTYEDLTERPVDADTHTLLREEPYNLKPCYVIESIPRHNQDNSLVKRVFWIWRDTWLPLKIDFYGPRGILRKTTYNHWVQMERFWTLKQSLSKDHKKQHETIIRLDKVEYNTDDLSDIYFNPSLLGLR
jgi:hypothetical protein